MIVSIVENNNYMQSCEFFRDFHTQRILYIEVKKMPKNVGNLKLIYL